MRISRSNIECTFAGNTYRTGRTQVLAGPAEHLGLVALTIELDIICWWQFSGCEECVELPNRDGPSASLDIRRSVKLTPHARAEKGARKRVVVDIELALAVFGSQCTFVIGSAGYVLARQCLYYFANRIEAVEYEPVP